MSEPFLGEIRMFSGTYAPRGWAFCDGQILEIQRNDALFAIIGTIYGGDGRVTFALPDLRGRVPKHSSDGNAGPGLRSVQLGERGGREEHELSVAEMPSHTHTGTMHAETAKADSNSPINRLLAFPATDDHIYSSSDPVANQTMHADSLAIQSTGGNQAFSINNPYLGINFIIALEGIFPPRS